MNGEETLTYTTLFSDDKQIAEIVMSMIMYNTMHQTISGWVWPENKIPNGKGVLVWRLNSIPNLERSLKEMNAEWVAIKVVDGVAPYSLRIPWLENCEVWGWGYTYGRSVENARQEAIGAAQAIDIYKLKGWLIDAEQEYKTPGANEWATAYINEFRKRQPSIPVGLCSYRYPELHSTFPWQEFLVGCDFHAPQVYWILARQNDAPGAQLKKSYNQLQSQKKLPVVPIGFACQDEVYKWRPTVEQIKNFVMTAKELGCPGYGWWELGQTIQYNELWEAVKK